MTDPHRADIAGRSASFLKLHTGGGGFVMPNAWDAGSAIAKYERGK